MATKAELEAELAALKKELKDTVAANTPQTADTASDSGKNADAEGLKQILADHGVDADSIESLSQTLLEELKLLQKERPLTLALAAFGLGLVVGRASK